MQATARKDNLLAIKDFEKLIERYPSDLKISQAYLALFDALYAEKEYSRLLQAGKEFLNLKVDRESANRTRAFLAEANLNLNHYLEARLSAEELLKNEPNSRQKCVAYSVQFQTLLDEKQYRDARPPLDALSSLLDKDPLEPFHKLIPEFKMNLAMRECATSHLLGHKSFSEDEISDYFSQKNLCYKSALPFVTSGIDTPSLDEWCEHFTYLNHELQKLKIDPSLKQKVQTDLKTTLEFSKTLSPELAKCYEPYKPAVKNKKRHRKRRIHSP